MQSVHVYVSGSQSGVTGIPKGPYGMRVRNQMIVCNSELVLKGVKYGYIGLHLYTLRIIGVYDLYA